MKFQQLTPAAAMAFFLSMPCSIAQAQVVFSVGAQEIYDSNVFLEDDNKVATAPLEAAIGEGTLHPDAIRQIDGNPNDDLITNAFIEAQGAFPIPKYIEGSGSAKLGALVFSDVSEQSRLTVDTAVEFSLAEDSKPEFLAVAVGDTLQSGTNSISSAASTASRTSETNEVFLDLGLGEFDVAPQTTAGLGYRLSRHDFLGEFLFSENNDIPDSSQFKERGADYFTNGVTSSLKNQVSQQVDVGLLAGLEKTNFTKVRSNSGIVTSDDPDRIDYRGALFTNYKPSEEFILEGQTGATYSRYDEQRSPQLVSVIDGTTPSVATITPDRDYTSLTFLGALTYLPQSSTSLKLSVGQDVVTDIDGERTLVRTVGLNAGHKFDERFAASAGVLFSQFDNAQNLGNASDRAELNAGVSYALTESIALVAGYNYITQNADSGSSRALSLNSGEYDVHRVFIGINAGLVGLSS